MRRISTGLTSAHIPDRSKIWQICQRGRLNGPDFGPYSGHRKIPFHGTNTGLNGPDFGPYSGLWSWSIPDIRSLNGPDFGPYSGQPGLKKLPERMAVSTGLTSAHIPDTEHGETSLHCFVSTGLTSAHIPDSPPTVRTASLSGLNGPDFGPYSGRIRQVHPAPQVKVSTGLTSAHIPDTAESYGSVTNFAVSTGLTSAHIPDVPLCKHDVAPVESQRA